LKEPNLESRILTRGMNQADALFS